MLKGGLLPAAGALAVAIFATAATGPEALAADKFDWAIVRGKKSPFDRPHLVQFFDLFYGDLSPATDPKKSGKLKGSPAQGKSGVKIPYGSDLVSRRNYSTRQRSKAMGVKPGSR